MIGQSCYFSYTRKLKEAKLSVKLEALLLLLSFLFNKFILESPAIKIGRLELDIESIVFVRSLLKYWIRMGRGSKAIYDIKLKYIRYIFTDVIQDSKISKQNELGQFICLLTYWLLI